MITCCLFVLFFYFIFINYIILCHIISYINSNLYIYIYVGSKDTVEKLEKHLKLLKEEYTKLQKNYAELERKYSKAAAANGENDLGEFSSFVSRLIMTVATLYGRKTYSDLTINLKDKIMPAHKFVLNARSEEWREEVLAEINELGIDNLKFN